MKAQQPTPVSGTPMNTARRISFARLSQKEAMAMVARHEMLFAGRRGGARAAFAFCDLSGLDLSGRNLADADFTGAVLEETKLAEARSESASFFGARFAPGEPCRCKPQAIRYAWSLVARSQPDRC
jgi:uncharacterized protein YjbI with pentapeptide repeats